MQAGSAAQTSKQSCLLARWLGCWRQVAAPGLPRQRCFSQSLPLLAAALACAPGMTAGQQLTPAARQCHGRRCRHALVANRRCRMDRKWRHGLTRGSCSPKHWQHRQAGSLPVLTAQTPAAAAPAALPPCNSMHTQCSHLAAVLLAPRTVLLPAALLRTRLAGALPAPPRPQHTSSCVSGTRQRHADARCSGR